MATQNCLTKNHRVLLADGTWKAVGDIIGGDIVSVPFLAGIALSDGVAKIFRDELEPKVGYVLTLEDGTRVELAEDGSTIVREIKCSKST